MQRNDSISNKLKMFQFQLERYTFLKQNINKETINPNKKPQTIFLLKKENFSLFWKINKKN